MPFTASKAAICWPNRVDAGTLSGGTWNSNYPQTNLQDTLIPVKARTSASTSVTFNLELSGVEVGVVALIGHNLTTTATWRVRLYSDLGTTLVYDSGTINAWDVSAEDALIYPTTTYHFADDNYTVQYITVDVTDSGNGDGYLEFGRMFAGKVWQAQVNMSYPFTSGLQTSTKVQTAIDGVTEYYDVTPIRRTASITFPALTREEAYLQIEKMQRTLGLNGELFWAKDLLEDSSAITHTYLATLDKLDAISQIFLNRHGASLNIIEKR